ncbi:MAG: lipase family protein, partial [Aquihabitans sp.]
MIPHLRFHHASAVLVAALLLAVPACSSDEDSSPSRGSTTTAAADESTTTTAGEAPEPEAFEGSVDDFYVVPDPLPAGQPGDLIRTQPLKEDNGDTGLRIMYHSSDVNGTDRAVTGVVYYPTEEPPEGGWPVLAKAHGTTGIASQCAPSRIPLIPGDYGVRGVRVQTDYIGLGPVGEVHSYLSATAEGNAMVDSVVAVHQIADAHAGDQWVVYGHSQGGHAALITNEIAAERAPQFDLLGTVAASPGAQLTETYGDTIQTRIITTMVLLGSVDEYPDLDPTDYLGPEAYAAGKRVVNDECLAAIIATMLPLAARDDFYVL